MSLPLLELDVKDEMAFVESLLKRLFPALLGLIADQGSREC